MNKNIALVICICLGFIISGCVVRTYTKTYERVDQDISAGNRGYLQGNLTPVTIPKETSTRTILVAEIELSSPVKFKRAPHVDTTKTADKGTAGNLGYISKSEGELSESAEPSFEEVLQTQTAELSTYVVQKNDTLEKIAKRPEIYGDSRKWKKIFDANKEQIKNPSKIYPGQTLIIPRD